MQPTINLNDISDDFIIDANSDIDKLMPVTTYAQADLDEFCLWLYGLYEDNVMQSE